jgi:NADH-quinone oxidoreductase subunit L
MFRLYATTFLGTFRGSEEQRNHLHESPRAITIPLIILAILSAVGGFVGIPALFAEGAHSLEHFLAPVFSQSAKLKETIHPDHNTEWILVGVSVVVSAIAAVFAWRRFSRRPELGEPAGLGNVLANKWYVDEFYDAIVVRPLDWIGKMFNTVIEKNVIDWMVNGVGRLLQYSSRQVRLLQSGLVGSYVLLMVLSILVFFVVQFFIRK